jgi:hypothetical protein
MSDNIQNYYAVTEDWNKMQVCWEAMRLSAEEYDAWRQSKPAGWDTLENVR